MKIKKYAFSLEYCRYATTNEKGSLPDLDRKTTFVRLSFSVVNGRKTGTDGWY